MTIPEMLRVLGKAVTVKVQAVKGDKDYGQCDHAACELIVSPKQTDDNKRDTLLHELNHFIDEEMQLKMTERQIRIMSTVQLAVLRDNPALLAYLTA